MVEEVDQELAPWQTLMASARAPEVDRAIRDCYQRLDEHVQLRSPMCWASGRCCNFNAYGHRLYVTALEIAWVVKEYQSAASAALSTPVESNSVLPQAEAIDLAGPCIFQVDGLCSIHAIRPMGCRVFFCQKQDHDWQQPAYEAFLNQLRIVHEKQRLPYRYIEWRAGLRDLLAYIG